MRLAYTQIQYLTHVNMRMHDKKPSAKVLPQIREHIHEVVIATNPRIDPCEHENVVANFNVKGLSNNAPSQMPNYIIL